MARKNKNKNFLNKTVIIQTPAKKKKNKRNRRKSLPNTPIIPQMRFPRCTMMYYDAIADPFSPKSFGACVPMANFRPTQKAHCKQLITVTIGSEGYGFCLFAPCVSNDNPNVWYTEAGYAGNGSTGALTNDVGVTFAQALSLPYKQSQLTLPSGAASTADAQGRVVSYGFRYRYTGTEIHRSGTALVFVDPTHQTVEKQSWDSISNRVETCVRSPNANHSENTCSIYAISMDELSFPTAYTTLTADQRNNIACYPYSRAVGCTNYAAFGAPVGGIWFTGYIGETYLVEVITHVEYVGRITQSFVTPNSSDPQGTEQVQAAASRANSGVGDGSSWRTAIRQSLLAILEENRPQIFAMAREGIRGMMQPRQRGYLELR